MLKYYKNFLYLYIYIFYNYPKILIFKLSLWKEHINQADLLEKGDTASDLKWKQKVGENYYQGEGKKVEKN